MEKERLNKIEISCISIAIISIVLGLYYIYTWFIVIGGILMFFLWVHHLIIDIKKEGV